MEWWLGSDWAGGSMQKPTRRRVKGSFPGFRVSSDLHTRLCGVLGSIIARLLTRDLSETSSFPVGEKSSSSRSPSTNSFIMPVAMALESSLGMQPAAEPFGRVGSSSASSLANV